MAYSSSRSSCGGTTRRNTDARRKRTASFWLKWAVFVLSLWCSSCWSCSDSTQLTTPIRTLDLPSSLHPLTLLPAGQRSQHAIRHSNIFSSRRHRRGDEASKATPRRRLCPSCQPPPASITETERLSADFVRIESIKRQILVKLGLHAKPNVSRAPSRDFILETLIRAEQSLDVDTNTTSASASTSATPQRIEATTIDPGLEDDFFGKTSEIIAFAERGRYLHGQVLAEFSRTQETEPSLRVKSAMLWLYVHFKADQRRLSGDKRPTFYVFRVQHRSLNGTAPDKNWNELVASQRVMLQHSGWMKINITEGVQKWFDGSNEQLQPQPPHPHAANNKLELLIDCSGCGSTVLPVLFATSSQKHTSLKLKSGGNGGKTKALGGNRKKRRQRSSRQQQKEQKRPKRPKRPKRQKRQKQRQEQQQQQRAFVVIHTDSTSSRRLRRRALDCSATTRACCKQRFFVSFRELGWDDWIIAPSGYYANYCRGDCGGPHRTPDTFLNYHTHVLEAFRKLETAPDLQPCCAPTKFSSMSLIYFGPDMNIIKRDLPKMVVDQCGCP